jgi:hypothetical protein
LFQAGSLSHSSCLSNGSCFSFRFETSLWIYWRGIDWKHPCDDETPPDIPPYTWSCFSMILVLCH